MHTLSLSQGKTENDAAYLAFLRDLDEAATSLELRRLLWASLDELDELTTVWMDSPIAVSLSDEWAVYSFLNLLFMYFSISTTI